MVFSVTYKICNGRKLDARGLKSLMPTNCRSWGDHTPLRFVTTCDNGVFNEGIFMHLSIFFPALFVDIKLL